MNRNELTREMHRKKRSASKQNTGKLNRHGASTQNKKRRIRRADTEIRELGEPAGDHGGETNTKDQHFLKHILNCIIR